ncbi:AI-2E family transporter [Planktothrix sp. FACHB-1355]|uniref:AI-2E family transporter n=1 Tax=Aerosakkonema funiforme FACHB-1375 TaxID=2949571 RepID=A0A926VHW0_9CYAN|nr:MULTISPECIES: AI-2E family transporter [Oscillatoriales]MBD2184180.1 AI-2E family transporter [Aerosakkonema funiforme FACHB-1375]MBD3558225.1 AI-2E family transporter [Planktothrix sp. FACHB-1355]
MLKSLNKLPRQFTIGLTFPIIYLNGWLLLRLARELQPLVSTLIAATLIAFLLDYPIRFLQERGLKRSWAAILVLLVFLLFLATLVLFVVPVILRQANELAIRLPEWLKSGQQQLQALQTWAIAQQLPIDLNTNLNQLIEKLTSVLRSLTGQLIGLVFSAIGSIVNVFLTLVFVIFLVLKGDSLWNGILSWLPAQWGSQIRQYLPQNFERYIAGQVTLAIIIAIAQTANLLILGVPVAQLFGFGIGAGSLIPFGGTVVIVLVSFLLALQKVWLGVKFLVLAVIINQIVENVLGPRIVGELTGLNPVWMLISLDIGVKLGGALGLLVAVPIAAFIKATFDKIRASNFLFQAQTVAGEIVSSAQENDRPADVSPSQSVG